MVPSPSADQAALQEETSTLEGEAKEKLLEALEDFSTAIVKTRQMRLSLRAGQVALQANEENSMLRRYIQEMHKKEAAGKIFVEAFLAFMTVNENNDLEIAQDSDERAMMNAIKTMMKSHAGVYGGDNLHGIELSLEEQVAIDALLHLQNEGSVMRQQQTSRESVERVVPFTGKVYKRSTHGKKKI